MVEDYTVSAIASALEELARATDRQADALTAIAQIMAHKEGLN